MTQAPSPDFHSVVLCGDSGSRLWPLSREQLPQPFTTGEDGSSLLQQTLMTLRAIGALNRATLVCGEAYRFVASDQLEEMGIFNAHLLLEPCGRGTAAAVACAALMAVRKGTDPVMLLCPAELGIDADPALIAGLATAHRAATAGRMVAFGMTRSQPTPRRPSFRVPRETDETTPPSAFLPMLRYIDAAGIERAPNDDEIDLWHSGVLIAKASVWIAELSRHAPEVLDCARRAVEHGSDAELVFKLELMNFSQSPTGTIESMMLPRSRIAAIVPLDVAWQIDGGTPPTQGADQDDPANTHSGDTRGTVVYATRDAITSADASDLILPSGAHRMNDGGSIPSADPHSPLQRAKPALAGPVDAFSNA
ncbi:sugar phosphate nucleotidyltransferase [Pigmentiphaga litoralis]|uniref:Mannose-1-phosphate guanylyltransferase n=1 Tax=Pigmentiphaga litoralis TaxID=516702 RepID=A0A7Y9IRD3_9BURK|nr:mannose-1-phosphate guanylyltransferase [Pigmentiphaga litoralis]NYE81158.1 mannose-1-phosphate guanylyltransferase [Pigmentiphaga litoralis]